MRVVVESGIRLEYEGVKEQPTAGPETVLLSASVAPGNIKTQVWFVYRLDEADWVQRKAVRQPSSPSGDHYLLPVSLSGDSETFRFFAFARLGPRTVPKHPDDATEDGSEAQKLVVSVALADYNVPAPSGGTSTTPEQPKVPAVTQQGKHEVELKNSKRLLYSASYVATKLTDQEQKEVQSSPGGGYTKLNALRALNLTPQHVERLGSTTYSSQGPQDVEEQRTLLSVAQKLISPQPATATMEMASTVAPVSYDAVKRFLERSTVVQEEMSGVSVGKCLIDMTNQRLKIFPIGRIHLERIEMYPAGVQKGELVFTVPMAPGETVTISHKEWSTSTREFEDVVQDYFESYSERGVAEKSDVAMSVENETKHSTAINFGASLSGSYAGVTLTTTLGITDTNDERQSVKESMQKTREVTEKASARTRKEHKVSLKVETKTGSEERSAKTITNTSANAIRVDYYRMMRKWRTDLYRYGLRQTYDIAIPMPGLRLWSLHQRLEEMDRELRKPLSFPLKPADIHSWTYRDEGIKWGTTVQDPPPETIDEIKYTRIEWLDRAAADTSRFDQTDIDVPQGYFVSAAKAVASLAIWPDEPWAFVFKGAVQGNLVRSPDDHIDADLSLLKGKSGHLAQVYVHRYISMASIELKLTYQLQKDAREKWQFAAWNQLREAAEARHREHLALLQDERDRLSRLLNGKDTLSLRRLEREELIRLVMQWLLGPDCPVTSTVQVDATVRHLLSNEYAFETSSTPSVAPTFDGIPKEDWYAAILFGEYVKFVHQAIEWENLLYFLYPYFWGSETLGRNKLLFEHHDPEHERFLRAGYARIVLPVRPGFEEDFTSLVEKGKLAEHLTHPYLTVAQDIANFARTNYAGIPPANPETHGRPLLYPEQRATWDNMQELMKEIDAFNVANKHYPAALADVPRPSTHTTGMWSPVDVWGKTFVYRTPGLGADYDLVSLGADNMEGGEGLDADISSAAGASLVATWYEYTPTSALDIEIDTKAEDIA